MNKKSSGSHLHGAATPGSYAATLQAMLPQRLREAPVWWCPEQVPSGWRPALYWLMRWGRLPLQNAVPGVLFDCRSSLQLACYRFEDTVAVEKIDGYRIVIDLETGGVNFDPPFEPKPF
jgi:hypothetical protein